MSSQSHSEEDSVRAMMATLEAAPEYQVHLARMRQLDGVYPRSVGKVVTELSSMRERIDDICTELGWALGLKAEDDNNLVAALRDAIADIGIIQDAVRPLAGDPIATEQRQEVAVVSHHVFQALALFSENLGLDRATVTELMRDQARRPEYRKALSDELDALINSDTTDWLGLINNESYCVADLPGPREARALVVRLLSPFAFGDLDAEDPWQGEDPYEEVHKAWAAESEDP